MKAIPTSMVDKPLWQQLRFAIQAWKKEVPSALLFQRILGLVRQLCWPNLRPILVRISVLASVLAFGNSVEAQNFLAPQMNPFSYNEPEATISSIIDFDGDGDFDITTSYGSNIGLFENTGTVSVPIFDNIQENIVTIPNNNSVFGVFGDIDNDGDFDFFGKDYASGTTTFSENTGALSNPVFSNLADNTFGIGDEEYVKLVDLDGDGDQDIITTSSIDISSPVTYYQNIGGNTSPNFAAGVSNPFGMNALPDGDLFYYFCDFSDLDGDGDLDALFSYTVLVETPFNFIPKIAVRINEGTVTAPAFGAPQINPFGIAPPNNIDAFNDIFLRDMDYDGDKDIILIGQYDCKMIYFEREGNVGNVPPSSLDGEITVSTSPFYNFLVADFSFSDPNPDDALDLIQITALPTQGSLKLNGNAVTVNQNVIAAQIPNLTFEPDAGEFGANYTSFLFKVYSNGLYSASEYAMVINVDENTASNDLNQSAWASVYPTLVEGNKSLVLTIKENDKVDAQLLDMSGRILETKNNLEQGQHEWSLANLPSGVYVMRVQAGTRTGVARIVKK